MELNNDRKERPNQPIALDQKTISSWAHKVAANQCA